MTSKIPISDNNFSIDKLYLGERNSSVLTRYIISPSATNYRILGSNQLLTSIYTKPSGNVRFRIVSNNAGDNSDVLITYINSSGDEATTTMTLNGTTNVDSAQLGIMINDVKPLSTVAGVISVYVDNNDDTTYTTLLGKYENGWQCSLYLVPNGKKLLLTYVNYWNVVATITYGHQFIKYKNWANGVANKTIESHFKFFQNGIYKTDQINLLHSAESGDLVYIDCYTSGGTAFEASMQYIKFDK